MFTLGVGREAGTGPTAGGGRRCASAKAARADARGMGRDRSLDEFFGGEGDASDAESEDARESGDAGGSADAAESDPEDDRPAATDADLAAEAEDADADEGGGANVESDALPDADAVDPATPTYRWTPEGAACESCGAVAERRWEDDGAFVCDDCKEW